jgi:hypothetical protein
MSENKTVTDRNINRAAVGGRKNECVVDQQFNSVLNFTDVFINPEKSSNELRSQKTE